MSKTAKKIFHAVALSVLATVLPVVGTVHAQDNNVIVSSVGDTWKYASAAKFGEDVYFFMENTNQDKFEKSFGTKDHVRMFHINGSNVEEVDYGKFTRDRSRTSVFQIGDIVMQFPGGFGNLSPKKGGEEGKRVDTDFLSLLLKACPGWKQVLAKLSGPATPVRGLVGGAGHSGPSQ